MKLLFDENLAPKLATLLGDLYPESIQVDRAALGGADDRDVWSYAETHGYTIVSKDSDYQELCSLRGHPPKVIWIRRGNCSTTVIANMLRNNFIKLSEFCNADDLSMLILL